MKIIFKSDKLWLVKDNLVDLNDFCSVGTGSFKVDWSKREKLLQLALSNHDNLIEIVNDVQVRSMILERLYNDATWGNAIFKLDTIYDLPDSGYEYEVKFFKSDYDANVASGYINPPRQLAFISPIAKQVMKEDMKQSKYINSTIGSHHWATTLLSFIMRTGEYLNDHGSETKDEHLRAWGKFLKEYATEVNDFIDTLPDVVTKEEVKSIKQ